MHPAPGSASAKGMPSTMVVPAPTSADCEGWRRLQGAEVEELNEVVGRRGSVGGGGWRSRLCGVRERTGGPLLTEGGSVPWARESLAVSLREKFSEAAVMEIVYVRRDGQGERSKPVTQMCKGWKEMSWKTEEVEEAQN